MKGSSQSDVSGGFSSIKNDCNQSVFGVAFTLLWVMIKSGGKRSLSCGWGQQSLTSVGRTLYDIFTG